MDKYQKYGAWVIAVLLFQLSIYLYFDKVVLIPEAAFQVSAQAELPVSNGKVSYSRNRRYMLTVENNAVSIYKMPEKNSVRTIDLGKSQVSLTRWLEDRELALIATYLDGQDAHRQLVLRQLDPLDDRHELSATIPNMPADSKITEVAYSTATNVIYMQVFMGSNPSVYRVYRIDANHDLTRVYLTSPRIGRIAVLYYQDTLIYDDLDDSVIIARKGDGSWRHISPPGGKYRLVGIDTADNIYIAKLNKDGLCTEILKGMLGVGFSLFHTMQNPLDPNHIKLTDIPGVTGR